jgi:hypothetical protein
MQPNGPTNSPKPAAAITPATGDQTQRSVPLPPPIKGISLHADRAAAAEAAVAPVPAAKPRKMRLRLALQTLFTATAVGALP